MWVSGCVLTDRVLLLILRGREGLDFCICVGVVFLIGNVNVGVGLGSIWLFTRIDIFNCFAGICLE